MVHAPASSASLATGCRVDHDSKALRLRQHGTVERLREGVRLFARLKFYAQHGFRLVKPIRNVVGCIFCASNQPRNRKETLLSWRREAEAAGCVSFRIPRQLRRICALHQSLCCTRGLDQMSLPRLSIPLMGLRLNR